MEMVYLSAAIIIGLGALATGIGFALLGGKLLESRIGQHEFGAGTGPHRREGAYIRHLKTAGGLSTAASEKYADENRAAIRRILHEKPDIKFPAITKAVEAGLEQQAFRSQQDLEQQRAIENIRGRQ